MSVIDNTRVPVEWRMSTVTDVRFAERTIDLIVVPYNEDTVVEYRGQMVTESFLPGSFAGLEQVPDRVVVNLDHDRNRAIGIARTVDTEDRDALRASVFISDTPAGNDALTLANDGVLAPSVGFAARPSDQRWSDGGRRRQILRAFIDHIALTSQQAYRGARVLAVRGAPVSPDELPPIPVTPRLDEVLRYLQRQG